MQPEAPPPLPAAELPLSVQLFRVQPCAPPPKLPARVQLLRVPPEAPPAPLVKVNPDRLALVLKDTHSFDWPPLIMVKSGPLTLSRVRGPGATIGAYTPLVTTTTSGPPASTTLMA